MQITDNLVVTTVDKTNMHSRFELSMFEVRLLLEACAIYLFTKNGVEISYVFYVNNVVVKEMAEGIKLEGIKLSNSRHNFQNSRKRVFSDR